MGAQNLSANSKNIKNFQVRQKLRGMLIVLIIGLPLLIGGIAYTAYRSYIAPSNQFAETDFDDTSQDTAMLDGSGVIDPNMPVSDDGTATLEAPSVPNPSTPSNTQSGDMPPGVEVALNSIEANGIKNNPYVTVDTSGIPDGTAVRTDRSTWTQFGPTQGAVNGTISAFGQSRQGSLTFSLVNDVWKVTSYSLDA